MNSTAKSEYECPFGYKSHTSDLPLKSLFSFFPIFVVVVVVDVQQEEDLTLNKKEWLVAIDHLATFF